MHHYCVDVSLNLIVFQSELSIMNAEQKDTSYDVITQVIVY